MRFVVAVALAGALTACSTSPHADVAPRRAYTGRLHVTFVTPGTGAIGDSPAKWMVEPAPASLHPRLTVADAKKRSRSIGVNQVDATTTRVYFGLFTGQDVPGVAHAKTPGWLVVGTHLRVGSQAPGSTPQYAYGVSVFSDDLTQPWVSGRVLMAERPVAY